MLVTRYSATISMFAECSTNFLTRLVFLFLSQRDAHIFLSHERQFIPHEQCVKHALYHLVSFSRFRLFIFVSIALDIDFHISFFSFRSV